MKIEMNANYQTRDGYPVRILCVDRKHLNYPVIGLIMDNDGGEVLETWTESGKCDEYRTDPYDLIEVPSLKERLQSAPADTKIVFNTGHKRYMSHMEGDLVFYFAEGTTSFTNDGRIFSILHSNIKEIVE